MSQAEEKNPKGSVDEERRKQTSLLVWFPSTAGRWRSHTPLSLYIYLSGKREPRQPWRL